VRNEPKLLPFASGTNIFNLAITNGDDRATIALPFTASMVRAGMKITTVVLDDRSTESEVQKALTLANGADLVVVSLYGRVRSGQANSVGVPKTGATALQALLDRKTPVIGISFGNPYLLLSFPALKTYLVAYGDMPSLQRAAANALIGKTEISGRLPISLPGLYPRGTGIQLTTASNR